MIHFYILIETEHSLNSFHWWWKACMKIFTEEQYKTWRYSFQNQIKFLLTKLAIGKKIYWDFVDLKCNLSEVWNSRVTKSSYETKLHKMTPHFELLTRKFLQKFFFQVTKSTS